MENDLHAKYTRNLLINYSLNVCDEEESWIFEIFSEKALLLMASPTSKECSWMKNEKGWMTQIFKMLICFFLNIIVP